MNAWFVVASCLLCGCHFDVNRLDDTDLPVSIDDLSTNDLPAGVDLASQDLAGVDLSAPDLSAPDLNTTDLRSPLDFSQPDLTTPPDLSDPCLPAQTLPANSISAHCAIGDSITIDGNLSDWPAGLFTANTLTHANAADVNGTWAAMESANNANLSADFAVRWDTTALYVAAHITDDAAQNFTSTNNDQIWKGDSIEVYVRSAAGSTGAYTANDGQFVFASNNESRVFRVTNAGDIPAGVSFAAVATSTAASWTFEVKIPWSVIGGTASLGRNLGLDIGLNDCDANGACRARYLIWKVQPVGAPCAACMGTCAPFCDTRTFYGLQLGGR